MNSTHFFETFHQDCCFIVSDLMILSMQTLRKQEWTELSWQNTAYNTTVSVEAGLEHGYTLDYTYFQ